MILEFIAHAAGEVFGFIFSVRFFWFIVVPCTVVGLLFAGCFIAAAAGLSAYL